MDSFHAELKGQFWHPFQLLLDPYLLEAFLPNLDTFQWCVFIHLCLLSFAFETVMVHECASRIPLLGLHNFFPIRPTITPHGLQVCSNHLATDTANPSSYLSVPFLHPLLAVDSSECLGDTFIFLVCTVLGTTSSWFIAKFLWYTRRLTGITMRRRTGLCGN